MNQFTDVTEQCCVSKSSRDKSSSTFHFLCFFNFLQVVHWWLHTLLQSVILVSECVWVTKGAENQAGCVSSQDASNKGLNMHFFLKYVVKLLIKVRSGIKNNGSFKVTWFHRFSTQLISCFWSFCSLYTFFFMIYQLQAESLSLSGCQCCCTEETSLRYSANSRLNRFHSKTWGLFLRGYQPEKNREEEWKKRSSLAASDGKKRMATFPLNVLYGF